MDFRRLSMNFWTPNLNRDTKYLANNFLLHRFVGYMWHLYDFQSKADQRRLIQWLLSANYSKKSREEQDLKLNLQPVLAFLSKSNKNMSYADENGRTILHLLFSNYVQNEGPYYTLHRLTMTLICSGASIISVDHNGITPLGIAIEKNQLDLLESLPSCLEYINQRNSLGETALHIVMKTYVKYKRDDLDECRYEKIIRQFVSSGANYNSADVNGITPVHYAAMKHYLPILKWLKGRTADVHCKTNNGDNCLIFACKNITMVENDSMIVPTIEWLLSQGYDVNYRNNGGHTALHYAVQSGCTDIVVLLIKCGADVSVVGFDDTTPLHSAIMSSCLENEDSCVVSYLLNQGMKQIFEEKTFGFGIEHLAAFNHSRIVVFHKKFVNRQSKSGLTLLHLAAMSANTGIVRELIELGAEVNCRENTYGYTPLHLAAMRGQFRNLDDIHVSALEGQLDMNEPNLIKHCFNRLDFRTKIGAYYNSVIDLLLTAGADINAKDILGRTPLHCAIQQPGSRIVEKLLKEGAHVDAVDNENRVPLQSAIMTMTDNWEVIDCLLKYGANIDDIETNVQDIYTRSKIYKISIADRLLRYAAKQKCLGLRSKSFYTPQYKKSQIDNFVPQYMKEIKNMKKETLKDNLSFYDMCYMTTKQRASLDVKPCHIIKLPLGFPSYTTIISGRYYEAVNRESMLESAKLACNLMMGLHCPDLCIEYIFSFLRNRDLRALIDSVWND